ncbi:ECF RNA polymerase sigma factor SigW [Bacillus sp. THAF10]|uniref:sigma-70 family RNA polymerase sigma factor n=1 Tax=Bacillus sp. THAF10 TaxID=2587848 RepID=UPI0012AA2DF7|nr:sigma-70 family RNA polymerase sigma factor [Bacillus sp. THAF10]QFT87965.1 ECF RNA polymerase sigma factor SigW [Bacillus sp. THAF10]
MGEREENIFTAVNRNALMEQLFEQYAIDVKRTAFLYVKDVSKAEDILQDVFISCYNSFDTFRGECTYKTWLIRITVNKCRDHARRWSFRNIFSRKDVGEHLVDVRTPELLAIGNETGAELRIAVFGLPLKLREVIILYYYQELSIWEISKLLDLNESTVKTRLYRARTSLKEMLKGGDYHWE